MAISRWPIMLCHRLTASQYSACIRIARTWSFAPHSLACTVDSLVKSRFARQISFSPRRFRICPNLRGVFWSGRHPSRLIPFFTSLRFFLVHEIPFYSIEKTFHRSLAYDFNGDHNLLLCCKSQPEAR